MPRTRGQASAVARVLLRLPADLQRSLSAAAAAAGLSFNELCVRRLAAPAQPGDASAVRALVFDRARAVFGDRLRGLVALGSWARGDQMNGSDIDVLIVIDSSTSLTRALYRQWDETPLSFNGRAIDVHFAHMPAPGTPPSAVWCEAAVDGLVWFDDDGQLIARLSDVRRAIADGRVVRAFAHGQPYWKGAA